jgi:hypothetical protein
MTSLSDTRAIPAAAGQDVRSLHPCTQNDIEIPLPMAYVLKTRMVRVAAEMPFIRRRCRSDRAFTFEARMNHLKGESHDRY